MVAVPAEGSPPKLDSQIDGQIVTLIDEAGGQRRFLLHDAFEVTGREYYLVEADDDPDLVLVLREDDGILASVEGAEFDEVMAILEDEEG